MIEWMSMGTGLAATLGTGMHIRTYARYQEGLQLPEVRRRIEELVDADDRHYAKKWFSPKVNGVRKVSLYARSDFRNWWTPEVMQEFGIKQATLRQAKRWGGGIGLLLSGAIACADYHSGRESIATIATDAVIGGISGRLGAAAGTRLFILVPSLPEAAIFFIVSFTVGTALCWLGHEVKEDVIK